jgi:hypothetical protein
MLGQWELAEWTRASGSQIYLDEPLLRLRVLGAHLPERPARMRGAVVTQLLPDAPEEGAPVEIEYL